MIQPKPGTATCTKWPSDRPDQDPAGCLLKKIKWSLPVCLLALGFHPLPAESQREDSPILSLDDVIGIEIQRSSLSERATENLKAGGLVIEDNRGTGFRLVPSFDPEAVDFTSFTFRTNHNTWPSAMMAIPTGIKSPPAVFVLDEECRFLQFTRNIPDDAAADDAQGTVYAGLPLGSHLIQLGFAVAFPTPRMMSGKDGTMTLEDWIALIRRFGIKARIDSRSLFLVATDEHAELALRLGAALDFAGVVIEAPGELLFVDPKDRREEPAGGRDQTPGRTPENQEPSAADGSPSDPAATADPKDPWKGSFFQSESQMIRYVEHTRSLRAPLMVVLAREAPSYEQTKKTLLTSLAAVNADVSVALLERSARSPLPPKMWTQNRRAFSYDDVQFEQWIRRMEGFLLVHSITKPIPLPLLDPGSRGTNDFRNPLFDDITAGPSAAEGYFPDEETPSERSPDPPQ